MTAATLCLFFAIDTSRHSNYKSLTWTGRLGLDSTNDDTPKEGDNERMSDRTDRRR